MLDSDDKKIADLNENLPIAQLLQKKKSRVKAKSFSELTDESYSWDSLILAVAEGDFKKYKELCDEPLSTVYEFYLLNIAQNYEHIK